MSLKELVVIHEENLREAEEKIDEDKCKFYEVQNHRRILRTDFTIFENFPNITIHKKWRETGTYFLDEKIIPENANALFVVGRPRFGFYDYVKYCKLTDDYQDSEENVVVEKKKKKDTWFFPFGLFSISSIDFKRYLNF